MKKILAWFFFSCLSIGVVISLKSEIYWNIAESLAEKYWSQNQKTKHVTTTKPFNMVNNSKAETVMIRLMQYNIGIFNYGIKRPSRDAGLRENEYEEKLNNYKAMFCKYQPAIIGLQEIIEYIDHNELHLTNEVLFDSIYPYKIDYFAHERAIKSKYPIRHIKTTWLKTVVKGRTYYAGCLHGRITIGSKEIDVITTVLPSYSDAEHKQARANLLPNVLSLLDDSEYGFIMLDVNCGGNARTTEASIQEAKELLAVAQAAGYNFANGGLMQWKDTYNQKSRGGINRFTPYDNIIYKDNGKILLNDFQVLYEEFDNLTSDHYPVFGDFTLLE